MQAGKVLGKLEGVSGPELANAVSTFKAQAVPEEVGSTGEITVGRLPFHVYRYALQLSVTFARKFRLSCTNAGAGPGLTAESTP